MPLDNQGHPRSGFGRTSYANEAHATTAGPKAKSAASTGKTAAGGGEKPAGEEHMHAHSHKGGEHDVSHMPIKDVVDQHGPATHIFSEHDHEAGDHHVHSVHGEKHHHSDHETHEAAHEHMGHALGVGAEDGEAFEGKETPDEEAAEATAGGGGKTPGWMAS